jgi:hypothetical protein
VRWNGGAENPHYVSNNAANLMGFFQRKLVEKLKHYIIKFTNRGGQSWKKKL